MKKIIATLVLFSICSTLFAQGNDDLGKAIKLKDEKNFREALPIYQKFLKSDSANILALTGASLCYTQVGFLLPTDAEKKKAYQTANYLSSKAIKLDNNSSDAHYTKSIAIGRLYENGSSKERIAAAKQVKVEADLANKLNPKSPGPYHVIGKWNKAVAGFSTIEKLAMNALFGGAPTGGTYEEAVKAFMNAIVHEPKYKMHMYELADTYYQMGKKAEAKVWLTKMIAMPVNNEYDKESDAKGNALLKKVQ